MLGRYSRENEEINRELGRYSVGREGWSEEEKKGKIELREREG